jgi:peptidoglycan/LPS O-acetylase OafA/YrhL
MAALGVVVWHYQHFGGNADAYPHRHALGFEWLYDRGWVLVDFFFLLSGCIFTYKYLEAVGAARVRAREFFVLRISRIYPLHLLTLLVVASMEWWRTAHHEHTLIYKHADLYHFFLNLTFLQAVGLDQGTSYNSPSWSVSVEFFVYIIFFELARRRARSYVTASVITALLALCVYKADWQYPFVNESMVRGILGFFLGSLLFLGLARLESPKTRAKLGLAAAFMLVSIAALAHIIGYDAFLGGSAFRIVPVHVLVLFPLVLTIALTLEPLGKALSIRPLSYLGDISFTVYLVHVPLQMLTILVFDAFRKRPATSHATFFWGFFGVVLVVAAVVHRFVEVPLRRRIRRRFLPRPTPADSAA